MRMVGRRAVAWVTWACKRSAYTFIDRSREAPAGNCRGLLLYTSHPLGRCLSVSARFRYLPTMPQHDRILIDSAICHGKPVIHGTRVPVTVVVGSLAGGMSFDEVQREYDLSADDIRAALRFVGEIAE
jgi:uncharacterized protein (DUF433 family)